MEVGPAPEVPPHARGEGGGDEDGEPLGALGEAVQEYGPREKKYQTLDIEQKAELCRMYMHERLTNAQLIERAAEKWHLRPNKSTMSRIIRNKEKWIGLERKKKQERRGVKRTRERKHPALVQVERELTNWVYEECRPDLPLQPRQVICKAREIAQNQGEVPAWFHPTSDWVYRWKAQQPLLRNYQLRDVEPATEDDVAMAREDLRQLLGNAPMEDIYCMGEAGIAYDVFPDKTEGYKARTGERGLDERLAVCLCVNATGSHKVPLFVIGRNNEREALHAASLDFGIRFCEASCPAMQPYLFREFLGHFVASVNDRGASGDQRHVWLLVDHAPAHLKPEEADMMRQQGAGKVLGFEYENVTVLLLPFSQTTHIQPMEAGIIKSFKLEFRWHQLNWIIKQLSEKQLASASEARMSPWHAASFLVHAWADISPKTLYESWQAAGASPTADRTLISEMTGIPGRRDDFGAEVVQGFEPFKAALQELQDVDENLSSLDVHELLNFPTEEMLHDHASIEGSLPCPPTEALAHFGTSAPSLPEAQEALQRVITYIELKPHLSVWLPTLQQLQGDLQGSEVVPRSLPPGSEAPPATHC